MRKWLLKQIFMTMKFRYYLQDAKQMLIISHAKLEVFPRFPSIIISDTYMCQILILDEIFLDFLLFSL